MPFSSMSAPAFRATVGATFLTSTGSVSLPLCVSSSATVTPIVLVSLAVLLPGARPSSRYWCWTVKPTWPVGR